MYDNNANGTYPPPLQLHLHYQGAQQQPQQQQPQQQQQQQHHPPPMGHPQLQLLKDNVYDNQPRFYTSPMVLQQPSYVQMNGHPAPSGGQYAQLVVYPSYQQQQQQQQQLQQQLQQQYFENVPVNNYMLIPNQGVGGVALTGAAAPQAAQPSTTTNNNNNNSTNASNNASTTPNTARAGTTNSFYSNYGNMAPQNYAKSKPTSVSSAPVSLMASAPPVIYANFPERLQQLLPAPPLAQLAVRPDLNANLAQKRAKRKSKFSKIQDDLIVSLKKKGKLWVEIAEILGVGSYLAARNRYQVIVGQQGNNNSLSWSGADKVHLQELLDAGELEKWRFISLELNKATSKNFTAVECRDFVRAMFWQDPAQFSVTEETVAECLKEKKITEKALEQRDQHQKKLLGKEEKELVGGSTTTTSSSPRTTPSLTTASTATTAAGNYFTTTSANNAAAAAAAAAAGTIPQPLVHPQPLPAPYQRTNALPSNGQYSYKHYY